METNIIYKEMRSQNQNSSGPSSVKLKTKQFHVWQGTMFTVAVSLHHQYTILRKTLYPPENYRRQKSDMK